MVYTTHKVTLLVIAIILFFVSYSQQSSAATVPKVYTNFITSLCNTTTYPSLCIKTLTPYASDVKTSYLNLCNAGLKVAVDSARNASNIISSLAKQKGLTSIEKSIIKDCKEDMKDAVDELKQTIEAMDNLEDSDDKDNYQWSNAKTYASAAITDTDSCIDGFSGRKVNVSLKTPIILSVVNVARVTSNVLSFINHLY